VTVAAVRNGRWPGLGREGLAGLTVAAYLIPQVMAYAQVAGMPAVAGLWAALPAMLMYAVLGSSRLLSMGPESTTALMTAAAVGPLAAGSPVRYAALAAGLAIAVGVLAVIAGLARLGFVADLLSRPVLTGYLAGVALLMIAGQLARLTGVPVTGRSVGAQVVSFDRQIGTVRPATVALAGVVLVLLFVVRARWPRVPGPLLVVLVATVVATVGGLDHHGVAVVGPVPAAVPVPGFPPLRPGDLAGLWLAALSMLAVAFSDDVLTARSFARQGEQVRANRELLALGAASIGAGLVHGFPVSSSASRTAIALSTGARSQAYSVVAAATVVGVLVAGGPVLAHFPEAALGAIVVYAAVRLIDVRGFARLASFRRRELVLALATTAGVLTFNILYGVLVAVGLSVADLLARVGRPHDAILGLVPGLAGMHDVDDYPGAHTIPGLVVYRYDAPLFFANAQDFQRRALAAAEQDCPVRWFVLNTEANVEVDYTALEAMEALRSELSRRGIVFALARVKQNLLDDLWAFGVAQKIGAGYIFPTLPTAVDAYLAWAHDHPHADGDGTAAA
jgi:sulfate permease, SulP family